MSKSTKIALATAITAVIAFLGAYLVDLNTDIGDGGTTTTTAAPSTTLVPSTTTATPTTTPPTSSTTTPAPTTTATTPILNLPRIPWEGGPDYYKQFPNAADWANPNLFPIGTWCGAYDNDAEVQYDKAHGLNFYTGCIQPATQFGPLTRNGMYWVGNKVNDTFDPASRNWPGLFLGDEIDGKGQAGLAEMQAAKDAAAGQNKFTYTNYTDMVIGPDMPDAMQSQYVNTFADVTSLDMYWYTTDFCGRPNYRGGLYDVPIPQGSCRTASSYGKTMEALWAKDGLDGQRKPLWQFIELLNGSGGGYFVANMTPAQVKGAAMASVINEARGIVWFQQSFSGNCVTSQVIRATQLRHVTCADGQVAAMGEVNNQIQRLASVINTQSYQWSFGSGLDTMLKAKDGSAYIFAMTENGGTGDRTLTLPAGVNGATVEVVDENRTIPVSGGKFTDTFAAENTYRIYKVTL